MTPDGELVTVPAPDVVTETVNCGGGAGLKVADTVCGELKLTEQAPVPEHAPLQPANTDPAAGVAARLTLVPEAYGAEHVEPQLMPAGELVIVPDPAPSKVVVSVTC